MMVDAGRFGLVSSWSPLSRSPLRQTRLSRAEQHSTAQQHHTTRRVVVQHRELACPGVTEGDGCSRVSGVDGELVNWWW